MKVFNQKVTECINYINENSDVILKALDSAYEENKEKVKSFIIAYIVEIFSNGPVKHFEWTNHTVDWSYDKSGDLKAKDYVKLDSSIISFLEDEYTGNWTPTFASGHGRTWDTYGDAISYSLLQLGTNIYESVLSHHLPHNLSKEEFWSINDEFHDFFFDNTSYNFFFDFSSILGFLGEGFSNTKIKDILNFNSDQEGYQLHRF